MTDTDLGGKAGGTVLARIAEVEACLKTAARWSGPVFLAVRLHLSSGGWKDLLSTIAAVGRDVNLDLSACAMGGTVFDPDYTNTAGKGKIVSLTLPDAATGIKGDDALSPIAPAFTGFTALTTVSGKNIRTVGDWAFATCHALTTVNLPQAAAIGEVAFEGCAALSTVNLGASLSDVKAGAFLGCTNLRAINVDGANPYYRSEGGMLLKKDGKTLVAYPSASGTVTVPLVTAVDVAAFEGCAALTAVSLPQAAAIGDWAFAGCTALAAVSLPRAAAFGNKAFIYCAALATVDLGASPPALGSDVFAGINSNSGAALTIRVPQGAIGAYTGAGWTTTPAGGNPARYVRDHKRIVIEEYTP
jgi:hypothetical protein